MFHIGIGRRWKRTPIHLYVADLDIRIVGRSYDTSPWIRRGPTNQAGCPSLMF
jgi:hypothetical protein